MISDCHAAVRNCEWNIQKDAEIPVVLQFVPVQENTVQKEYSCGADIFRLLYYLIRAVIKACCRDAGCTAFKRVKKQLTELVVII